MKPKILSWNVIGLNEGGKQLKVRNIIRQWKVGIICLQEIKLEILSNNIREKLVGLSFC
jgi:exonuclease III